jgi:hypothetical protein
MTETRPEEAWERSRRMLVVQKLATNYRFDFEGMPETLKEKSSLKIPLVEPFCQKNKDKNSVAPKD